MTQRTSPIRDVIGAEWFSDDVAQSPGLTLSAREIPRLAENLSKGLTVLSYKQSMPCLWVLFLGGTGTGKSTLFNCFSGKPLSETGMERPRTFGPIVYAHRHCPIEEDFPFSHTEITRQAMEDGDFSPATGRPGGMLIVEHEREDRAHLVVVDTPDLDSVEAENRQIAEDLYLLCDVVVFVTTQEKYADEVPYRFFLKIMEARKPYFFLLNKAQEPLTAREVLDTFEGQGLMLKKDRLWLIPYAPADAFHRISESSAFQSFLCHFSKELQKDRVNGLRKRQRARHAQSLNNEITRLLYLLKEEQQAAQRWLNQLATLYEEICRDLIMEEKERFTAQNREYIQREIRQLFARYDVLAKPRRFMREILLIPLQLLGLPRKNVHHAHKDDLLKVRRKIDLTPVQRAIEKFNRLVLERLSPPDETSLLFRQLRDNDMVLHGQEIRDRVWKEQDELHTWLENTFQKLSKEIPKHKKWGIYSTSILWGLLILSLEIVVGGGFSVLDAVLDSAVAPFVTKGAVELFAYHEIQKTTRRLAKRYQEGLLSVVRQQHNRYESCIQSLMTPSKAVVSLETLQAETSRWS